MELTLKTAVVIGLKIAITVLMVSLGMETSRQALLQLWSRPRLLIGSLIAAFVVVPLVACAICLMVPLSFGTKAGLFAISITPGAPMIYRAAMKRGVGNPELAASFQVAVALLVIVLAPAWLKIASAISGGDYWIPPAAILKQVSTIQLIPLLVGLALHAWLPTFAERVTPTVVKVANIVLLVLILILLAALGPRILAGISIWLVSAVVLLAVAAIAGGHLLAGPERTTRLTIANANVQRNVGLAVAIAAWNAPGQEGATVVAILICAIAAMVLAAVYTKTHGKSSSLDST